MTVARTDRNLRLGFLYYVETDTPLRFWTGMGPIHVAPNGPDTEGGIYLGLDFNTDLPTFSLLVSGTADTLTLGLSGVDDRLVELVDLEAAGIEGRDVHIGFIQLDAGQQIAYAPYWMSGSIVQDVTFGVTISGAAPSDETHTAGVALTLVYGDPLRKRGKGGYWTPDRAGEGDFGYSHVPGLDAVATRQFPPPSAA